MLVVGPNRLWNTYVAPVNMKPDDVLVTFDSSNAEVPTSFSLRYCGVRSANSV